MRGSVRKRGRGWEALWDGPPDPETGRRRQKSKAGFRTRREAEAHLAAVVQQVHAGTFVEPSRQPLGAYLESEWLPAIGSTVVRSTARRYQAAVNTIRAREIAHMPLRSISAGTINGLYAALAADGMSPGSIRIVHAVMSRSMKDAVRWGKLSRSPVPLADPPAAPRTRVTSWTATELRAFLEHVHGDRLSALWRLSATTGMRRGEKLGLQWIAVDLEHGRIRVEQQLKAARDAAEDVERMATSRGPVAFGGPKSRRSVRTIALDAGTVEALREHRDRQLHERDRAGAAYVDHDLVFADEIGRPIHPQTLTELFPKARNAAGIPAGTLHVLRHTAVTLMLTSGIPLHVVAARIGDEPKTVLATYAHLLPTSDQAAADAIAAQLVGSSLADDAVLPAVEPKVGP